jgi:TPR repeat protein
MGDNKLKKIGLILFLLIVLGAIGGFLGLRYIYAPQKIQFYAEHYSQDLQVCPNYKKQSIVWLFRQGIGPYLKKAETDPTDFYDISVVYQLGLGVEQDKTLSQEWLMKAVSVKDPRALFDEGAALYGAGNKEGLDLINEAAAAGNSSAKMYLALLGPANTSQQNLTVLANAGSGAAQLMLAETMSGNEAFELTLSAANNPNTPTSFRVNAIQSLISAYSTGSGVGRDVSAANEWQKKLDYILANGCDPSLQGG